MPKLIMRPSNAEVWRVFMGGDNTLAQRLRQWGSNDITLADVYGSPETLEERVELVRNALADYVEIGPPPRGMTETQWYNKCDKDRSESIGIDPICLSSYFVGIDLRAISNVASKVQQIADEMNVKEDINPLESHAWNELAEALHDYITPD